MAKKRKRKIRKRKLLNYLIVFLLIGLFILFLYNVKVSNIIVKGNTIYTDWQIIKKANLQDNPSAMQTLTTKISNTLEKDSFIKKAKVTKRGFTTIVIKIEENKPLFYYVSVKKTILKDGSKVDDNFSVPTLVNYVPNKTYDKLLNKINTINYSLVKRMSEIKYDPNNVDQDRFLITMNDGNYVYITLNKFGKINNYVDIIKEFNNKKGILYLDSGEYFKIIN